MVTRYTDTSHQSWAELVACCPVTVPREQALDSEIFLDITERGVEMAKKMRSGTQVSLYLS